MIASWSWTESALILAGDHGGGGQAARDLLRDVRAREHRDRPVRDERREPVAGRRVEALRQAEDRARAGERGDGLGEGGARHGDDGEIGLGDRRVLDRRGGDPVQVDVREVARVAAGLRDRGGLLGVAAGERHLVPVVAQEHRERRAPGAAADRR